MEGGEELEVTEENKLQYLNALARYRLTRRVGEEIEQFIKGTYILLLLLCDWLPQTLSFLFDDA